MADAFPISGQIDPKAFPFLVVQLHRRGATGSLKVEGPSYHKALYFRSGRVLFGSSNDPRDQLGAILIEGGKITPEQLEDVNAKVGPGNPLAKVLSDTGFVSQRELSDAARAKVERILSDVLAYSSGTFDFEDGVLPKGAVDLKLSTERLVMAAVRRIGDRAFVLRHVESLDAVLGPTAEMVPRLGEVESEAAGFPQVLDGRRNLKEAAASARLEEFEAAKIACGLLFLGLVERVKAGGKATGVTASAAQAATFADAEPGAGELDLGATAAQAFAAPFVEPMVEPQAPAAADDQEEPPPFMVDAAPGPSKPGPVTTAFAGIAPSPATEAPSEFRFEVPPIPPPEPTPEPEARVVPEAEPPAPPVEPEPQTVALSAPPLIPPPPRRDAEPPSVPAPAVASGGSPLPLVMPEPRARTRPSPPVPEPAEPMADFTPQRPSRPSKDDLAALDALLNKKTAEPSLTGFERPVVATPQFARSVGGRRESSGSRMPVLLGVALVVLLAGAGAWYYLNYMQPPKRAASASPAPVRSSTPPATTPPATAAGVTTLAAAPSTMAAAPATVSTPPPVTPTTLAAVVPPPVHTPPPTTTPPRATAAPTDARALLRGGRYAEAARSFAGTTRAAGRSGAVIQLFVACSTETVQKAVENTSGSELFILPVNFKGRDCYRLCWGVYSSEARATAALGTVPEYFRSGGATPKVLPTAEVVP